MRLFLFILFTIFWHTGILRAQSADEIKKDTTALSLKKRVDTLVKYTRNQFYQNNFDLTIEVGENTLKLAREIKDTSAIFALSSLMGNSFLQIDDSIQAKRIFSEAILEAENLKDSASIVTARIDLGNLYALQNKPIPAINLYNKAIPLAKIVNDSVQLFILNYNIAELNLDMKEVNTAEYYVKETNKYIKNDFAEAYLAAAKLNDGKLSFLKKRPEKAIENLKESIKFAINSGYTDPLIEGYEYYAKSDSMLGNFKSSYELLKKRDSVKNEKYKTDKIQAIENVTARFKLNQYQQEIKAKELQNEVNKAETKRETTILWVKIASTILFISSIILLISYLKRKKLLVDLIEKNKQYLKAKEETEELSKARSILFSNITHELRTPMYGIIGISSILMKERELKGHNEYLRSLKFSANHLLSLINNVLHLTKIDATKKEELNKGKFNIRSVVKNIVKSSKFINSENPNTYVIKIDDKIPQYLLGDDVRLSQILINLIGNASKFTNNGTITISINYVDSANEKEVILDFIIEDTGIGISEEKQKHIFNEFAQTEYENKYKGTGLGLPIVKKILGIYGSEIDLKSTVGKGTTIRFSIGYEKPKEQVPVEISSKINNSFALKDKRILVVDDNKINLVVTRKTLELYGALVTTVDNGQDSIQLTKDTPSDLILMDINMPEMNGFEATEAIRSFNKDVPIVALTAVEIEKVIGANSFNLMDDLIIKPYKNEDFLSIILKHLATK